MVLLVSWTLPITNCGGCRAVAELLQPCALCLSCLELQVWGLSFCWSPPWWLPRRHVLVKYQIGAISWLLANSPDSRGVSVDLTRVLQFTQPHCIPVHTSWNHLWSSFVSGNLCKGCGIKCVLSLGMSSPVPSVYSYPGWKKIMFVSNDIRDLYKK